MSDDDAPRFPPAPTHGLTALDKIIGDAIEKAREETRREVIASIEEIGGIYEIKDRIAKEAVRMINEDPEIKDRIKAAILRALDNSGARPRNW